MGGAVEKVKLTDPLLKSLAKRPAPARKTYDVPDQIVPGLHVLGPPKGRPPFILLGRFGGSKNPTRRARGEDGVLTLEKAREKAQAWHSLIKRGIDPRDQE